jgi:hypothetical protein
MHRTTINLPEPTLRKAKLKALHQNVTLSEVLRTLLARWADGEIGLAPDESNRARLAEMARRARGMWAERDADAYLATSRSGLVEHDEETQRARLGS